MDNNNTIILALDRRSCCWHWKIARGRSVDTLLGRW